MPLVDFSQWREHHEGMTNEPPRNHRAEWNASYEHVRSHIDEHGYPTQRTIAPDGTRPGKWLAKQKERWGTLAPSQQEALLGLPGFSLDWREAHFDAMVDAYVRAVADGFTDFRKEGTYEGYPLGQWLHDMDRGRIILTAERIAKLRAARILS